MSLSGLKEEALVLKSKSIMRNSAEIKFNVWIPPISELQAVRTLCKFIFKILMPCNRPESSPMFSKQEYSEGFGIWLSGMPVSWRIIMILYIKENTNFWESAELPCFLSERRKATSWTTLQHNSMLLTAGGSVELCWFRFQYSCTHQF